MSFVDKKGIVVASGFKLQAEVLLDARQQVDTIEERNELVTIHAATAGLRVFVKETGKSYVYNGTTWQELTVGAAYKHPTGDGNHHVPATGTSNNGKVLMAGSTAGSESWQKLTKSDISDFPTSLPNPAALTISLNGTSQGAYNGSSAKNINITPDSIGASEDGHTHNYAGSSTVGGAANSVKSSLVVKLNGGSSEGTNMFTFNGSAAKSINITASGIGAAATNHTHTHDKITDFDDAVEALLPSIPTSLPNPAALTISLNGTSQGAYNGSSAKNINITASSIGAAAASHSHSLASTSAAGYLRQLNGSTSQFMRGDGTWATPPNTTYSNMTGASTSAAGKAGLVPAPVAGAANRYLRSDGTWAVPPDTKATLSSLGITATADEINKLDGVTATKNEINFLDGVTSAIQTQLNGKASTGHTHNYAGSSSAGGAANSVKSSLVVKLNGGSNEGTNMFTFNGGTAKTINITASSIGAATSGHSHTHDKITDFDDAVEALIPSSLPTANSLIVKLNGGTNEGTNQFTFNGSVAKTVNITPSAIGAAASSHTHNYAGSTSAGGAANSAVKLQTARKLNGTTFNGTVDVNIPNNYFAQVSSGTDLNNMKTYGEYYASGGSGCKNIPSGVDHFYLRVFRSASGYTAQYLYEDNKSFTRFFNGKEWTGWIETYTSANKPTLSELGAAAASHTHTASQITGLPTALKNPYALTFTGAVTGTYDGSSAKTINIPTSQPTENSLVVKLNGGTKEGTNMFTFNGSTAKSINITPAAIGAAVSSHNHSAANITSGTLTVARGGTGITANPSMLVNLGSTSAASVFAASPRPGITGTLSIAHGGTGATTAAAARTALGITPANIGAATTSHDHTTDDITDFEEAVSGLIPSIPTKLPNPQALKFTGAVSATYDGSAAKTINIPTSGATDEDLIIKLNSGSTEGTNMFTFDGSAAKTVNITPSSIGAAASNHSHSLASTGASGYLRQLNGSTSQFMRGDGTWATPPNTTYSNMTGASSSVAGKAGLVPAPSAGAANRYLRSDGTWAVPPDTNTTYSNMTGASNSAAGKAGLVPAPAAGAANRYLRSDGTWQVPPDTKTTLSSLGITATASEINKLDGVTATKDEINFLDGVTSNIQTQLNRKASSSHTHNYAGSSSAGGAANSANRLNGISLTGGSGNTTGYRLIATVNINAWGNYRGVFAVNSRHTGAGLLCISVGCNNSPVSFANAYSDIMYFGPVDSGNIITSDSFLVHMSSNGTKAYIFWKYSDYNTTTIVTLDSDFAISNGTWMTSISTSTYGNRKATTTINPSSAHNHSASNITSGTLPVARGGTGLTASPSMLTNLGSTTAASVFQASPRPGITGTLAIAHGGTGATSASAARTALGAAASSHTHNYAGSSSAGGAANSVKTSLIVKLNGGSTEGTNMFTFNGSAAKTINITPSSIGAAASNHTHSYLPLSGGTVTGDIGLPSGRANKDGSTPFAGSTINLSSITKLANYKTVLGSYIDSNGKWYDIISVRHRNGNGDGSSYGMYLKSDLTASGNLSWGKQYGSSSWQAERTLIDSSNYGSWCAAKSHTHNYAGSSSAGGAAISANKVNVPVGTVLFSTSSSSTFFSSCFGGTWTVVGNVDAIVGGSSTLKLYMFRKTAS